MLHNDEDYIAGVQSFPAETEGLGGQPMEPVMDGDVKVFELTAQEIEWEVAPGDIRQAMAYNGQVPGPEIRVQLGDRVRVILHNELPESTGIHYHGLTVPNDQDGVPGLTQPLVLPGESYTYEFDVVNSGSHMYHSHMNGSVQIPMGLLGAFIVEDGTETPIDQDVTMILNDGPLGYTINGKGFPATQPIVANVGDRIRIRYMNEGLQIHPMHLHGMPQLVVAKDGYPLPQPHMEDTVTIAPGERIDVIVEVTEPGLWAFHCHILSHAEGPNGMFGMVTVFVVNE
jgi:FtsP/CotA-like multicopper oxidase with cupredoxin domain